tara:strand:+ start:163 stop:663 length:501 start_codon:yes stop_codon:yes gene_type:complete
MNLKFYLEKLHNSEEYKNFMKENPNAFLCSGFFSIDKIGKDNKQHFDFCVKNKIFSFQLEDSIKFVPVEEFGGKIPEKISQDCDFNFDYIEKLIAGEMFEQKIKNKIQKILLSLQNKDGKDFLIGTIFVSSMGLIKVKIDLSEMKVIEFVKKNFLDMVNVFKKDKN